MIGLPSCVTKSFAITRSRSQNKPLRPISGRKIWPLSLLHSMPASSSTALKLIISSRNSLKRTRSKYTMEIARHFSNMAVTFNFYCAKHFDNDHSWACGVCYNEVQLSQAQRKRHSIPKSCGGHFVVPTLGVACDLTAPATFILWNGSRHLHATAIMKPRSSHGKPHHMVSLLHCCSLMVVFADAHWHFYADHLKACQA